MDHDRVVLDLRTILHYDANVLVEHLSNLGNPGAQAPLFALMALIVDLEQT